MLTALIGPVSNLLGKFIEDKDMKNKLAHEVATMAESHAQELAKEMEKKFWSDLQERLDEVKQNPLPYKYQAPEIAWKNFHQIQ